MVRILGLFLTVLMTAGSVLAQGGDQPPAHHPKGDMHDQMMKEMQANLDTMHATVQKMKDQLAKVADVSTRDQLRLNISLWESMVGDMEKHMHMMQGMMRHEEGMNHEKMGDHRNMKHDEGMRHGEGKGMCCCCGGEGMSCSRKAEAPATPKSPATDK